MTRYHFVMAIKIILVLLCVLSLNAFAELESETDSLPLTKYHPTYFIYGVPNSKLQLSFKYQLIKTWPLFIGYTQIGFWRLLENSMPFFDQNYNPELFTRWTVNNETAIDFGYEHMSNGRDGANSRSIHRVFSEVHFQGPVDGGAWSLDVRFRQPIIRESDSSEYDRYAGGTLMASARLSQVLTGIFDEGVLYFRILPGGRWLEEPQLGSQEVGFSFRLGGIELSPSIFVQYFHGYAESMLEYKEEVQNLRFGILL